MEIDSVTFTAYFKPQAMTVSWYSNVLMQLSHYGLSYHRDTERVLLWDEVLQSSPDGLTLGADNKAFDGTIAQWLEQVPIAVLGSIDAYDRGIRIRLELQPNARYTSYSTDPMRVLGKVTMHYEGSYFQTDGAPEEHPVPSYLQMWQAHLHWAEMCCRMLTPIYAWSYQSGNLLDENYLDDAGEREQIEVPLLDNKLPQLAKLIGHERLQYFGSPLLAGPDGEQIQALAHTPGRWLQYLPAGGLLMITPAEPFHYGLALGYNQRNLARGTYELHDESLGDRQADRSNELLELYWHILGEDA